MYVQLEGIMRKQLQACLLMVKLNFYDILMKQRKAEQPWAPPLPLALCDQGKQTLIL